MLRRIVCAVDARSVCGS